MTTELPRPPQAHGIAEILQALGVRCELAGELADPYLVIPGNSGPRWLIPARPGASAPVLSSWHPYDLSSRIKWLAIRLAARTGLLQLLPSVSTVAVARGGAQRWFERCGISSHAGEMVVLVGVPSADRKLVAFLLDDAHRIAAVLKVGVTESGGLSLLHEADVLRKLAQYSWAPKLLSVHTELHAAAQEYVRGEMPGRGFRPEYMDILCRMPQSGGSRTLADFAGEMARRFAPFKVQVERMAPDLLERALGCLDLDISLPTMLVHGDLAPWNMRSSPQAGYVLVDWEWADFAGLPAYDLLHFQFNDDRLFGEKAGGYPAIRTRPICAEYFRRMDLDAELLPRLAVAYLLHQLESHCKLRGAQLTAYTLRQLAAAVADVLSLSRCRPATSAIPPSL